MKEFATPRKDLCDPQGGRDPQVEKPCAKWYNWEDTLIVNKAAKIMLNSFIWMF